MAKGLSPDVLAATALALVDRDGLPALSMRRLATELDVDPMAAYRHLPNKDALLDAVLDAVLAEVDLAAAEGGAESADGWQTRVSRLAVSVLDALARHPHAAPLLSARTWTTKHGMAITERGMSILIGAGVHPHKAVLAMNATGLLLTALGSAMGGANEASPHERLDALDPAAYPTTMAALAGGHGVRGYPELLDFWLGLMLADLAPR